MLSRGHVAVGRGRGHVGACGACAHSPSVKPMQRPFGRSVATCSASNGNDFDGFETTGDGSTKQIAFLIYKCCRRHLSMYDAIEEFVQTHNNLMPIRYSYPEIKKMTENFKDKLGEGGYDVVYKGMQKP